MTMTNLETSNPDKSKELQEENELLLQQLHYVQEELEKYYLRNKELESGFSTNESALVASQTIQWVDEDSLKAVAENLRLQALAETGAKVSKIYDENALQSRIGEMLIEAGKAPATLPATLLRIHKVWREASRKKPPSALGGKEFKHVLEAHGKDGFEGVDKLLANVKASSFLRADAYRAISKHQAQINSAAAVGAARRSFEADPRPYRQKWLAYMLYDAGEVLEAEALMELMPPEHELTDWDKRQRDSIRAAANRHRMDEAKKRLNYKNSRAQIEQQLQSLRQQIDAEKVQGSDLRDKLTAANKRQQVLETEKNQLNKRSAEHAQLLETRARELEQLRGDLSARVAELDSARASAIALEQEKAGLEKKLSEHGQLLETRALEFEQLRFDLSSRTAELEAKKQKFETGQQEIHALKALLQKLELENAALQTQLTNVTKLGEERSRLLESNDRDLKQLRGDLSARGAELEVQKKKLENNQQDMQSIKTVAQKLEHEKAALQTQLTEATKLGDERLRLLEANDRDLKQLRGDLSARVAELEAQKKKLETGQQEIQAFKTAAQKLEQEKAALQTQLTEAKTLADERGRAIEELKQKINSRLEAEKELEARQTLMNEEVLRAEAQIDLIRDMLLREPGL
jgi:hypothetical protein